MATCNLSARVSVTGDCLNTGSGAFTINIVGSTPPFYYQLISPTTGALTPLPIGVSSFTQTNLTPNTYTFLIQDSCAGSPTTTYVNAVISDGVCSSIYAHSNTTCNLPNGVITAQTDNNLSNTDYFLFENTSGYITSGNSIQDFFIFSNLNAGTYYVIVNDGGGCSGKSETCIIKTSSELDFGFYIVNDTACDPAPGGKIYVTGATGFPPYVYQWSPSPAGNPIPGISSLTGLTAGVYQLTLTDSTGCQVTKLATVDTVPPVGIVDYIPVSPSCSGNEGQITILISGGTPPYNYVASNGESLITFNQQFVLSGLSSGVYDITITDAGLCTSTYQYSLTAPNGFSILTVGIVNSTCNNSSGALSPITLNGGTPPFTYTLTYPSGNSIEQTINGFTNQFQGLSAGTYTLTISNTSCSFTNTYTINNTEKFTFSTEITGSTCDTNNGSVKIVLSTGGTSTYTYQFQGQPTISNTSQTAVTFNNLFAGTYFVSVSDFTNCTQTQTIIVPDTPSIDFTLVPTDASNINNGQVQTYITDGPPPYTVSWISNNVNGQTGLTLTNLSAGTYTALITDGNGCQLTRSTTIYGYNSFGTYDVFDYCESTLLYNGVVIAKKIPQMYTEGYYDLVSGETNCVLNEAIFYSQVSLAGVNVETAFYTSNSLGDYPTDNQWFDAIKDALLSYSVIGNVIILPDENRITIQTNCSDLSLSLDNSQVTVALKISYDVSCVCNIPPTPGPVIKDCDMIYIQPPNEAYAYEFSSDTSSLLTITEYTYDSQSIAFTSSKLWVYSVGVNSSSIQEYDITLNGFTSVLNRTLNVGFEMGEAIGVRSNTKLVTVNTSTQGFNNALIAPNGSISGYLNYFVELDITTNVPVISNKVVLSENRNTVGRIIFNQDYSQMISLQVDESSAPFEDYYICVHETNNYSQLIESQINPVDIAGEPSGLFVDNGVIYLVDDTSNVYEVDTTFPYSVTYSSEISAGGSIDSIAQQTNCFTELFSICEIECGNTVSVEICNASNDGIFETYVNVGSGIGVVQVTFTYQTTSLQLPIRYQIEWNNVIVADSLFVYGNNLQMNGNNGTITYVTGITNSNIDELGTRPVYRNKYLYCEGNGNAISLAGSNINWLTNSIKYGPLGTLSEISNYDISRSTGTPGQIGVVNNYPTPASPSSEPNLILQFTKTSAGPNIIKVICSTATKMGFTFQVTQCP